MTDIFFEKIKTSVSGNFITHTVSAKKKGDASGILLHLFQATKEVSVLPPPPPDYRNYSSTATATGRPDRELGERSRDMTTAPMRRRRLLAILS